MTKNMLDQCQTLLDAGYTVYDVPDTKYGFIITPDGHSVIYVQEDYFYGYTFSLQYKPSREYGTGCRCLEDPVPVIDLYTVRTALEQGQDFAAELQRRGEKLIPWYTDADEWKNEYWAAKRLVKLENGGRSDTDEIVKDLEGGPYA